MANLPEANEYPAGVYMLETSDPVIGGYPNEQTGSGMANIPNLQLAKRTNWLKSRVDALLNQVVAATTAVAGIVQLSTSTNSTSTTMAATPSAVKAVNDAVGQRAMSVRTITGAGLATGGGDLSANRTITVPIASKEQAEAGTDNTTAMTPLRVSEALAKQKTITNWDDAVANGIYQGLDATNAPGTGWYIGDVIAHHTGWVTQTITQFTGDSASDTKTYRRERNSTGGVPVWGAWYRLRLSQGEQAALWAPLARNIRTAGLATGGGDLSDNRTITVPIASQAQAEAGTDNATAMTPLRVKDALGALIGGVATAAGFAVSTGVNGYVRLPSWLGGIMIQWGSATQTGGLVQITWPLAFPSGVFVVNGTHSGTGSATVIEVYGTLTKTGVTMKMFNPSLEVHSGWIMRWIAIGY